MPKFKKKDAISVEAIQWTGTNTADILALTLGFTQKKPKPSNPGQDKKLEEATEALLAGTDLETEVAFSEGKIIIRTPQGNLEVNPSDWLIKGSQGEFYAAKPDQFTQQYEPVI